MSVPPSRLTLSQILAGMYRVVVPMGYDGAEFNLMQVDLNGQIQSQLFTWNPAILDFEQMQGGGDPLSKYKVSDDLNDNYIGFVATDGSWYILWNNSGQFRYARGSSNYPVNFSNRANLVYDYFYNVF